MLLPPCHFHSRSRIETIATLYRDAYEFSNIGGVDLHAFLYSANKNHFFTSCQRLPVFYGAQNAEVGERSEPVLPCSFAAHDVSQLSSLNARLLFVSVHQWCERGRDCVRPQSSRAMMPPTDHRY